MSTVQKLLWLARGRGKQKERERRDSLVGVFYDSHGDGDVRELRYFFLLLKFWSVSIVLVFFFVLLSTVVVVVAVSA